MIYIYMLVSNVLVSVVAAWFIATTLRMERYWFAMGVFFALIFYVIVAHGYIMRHRYEDTLIEQDDNEEKDETSITEKE